MAPALLHAAADAPLPPDALLVPVVFPLADRPGDAGATGGASAPELLLGADASGALVAEAFTSPARLVARWGSRQPWVACSRRDLAVVLLALGVDVVVLDAATPDERVVRARREPGPDA